MAAKLMTEQEGYAGWVTASESSSRRCEHEREKGEIKVVDMTNSGHVQAAMEKFLEQRENEFVFL